ncbi:MAG: phytoene desaturase [Bacteroidia bacterium]|nr:phytoene desaturase [Bacteroidia bacterium]
MKRVSIIGSGIAGMSAACVMAEAGYDVTVIEKNDKPGGRINVFEEKGFRFDMGPSWYWMPEVFENFYNRFGFKSSDFYELRRLDPSYRVWFDDRGKMDIPADFGELKEMFDKIEPGSGLKLEKFINHAKEKYDIGMSEFVWKPGQSIFEFADIRVFRNFFRLQLFKSISNEIGKVVTNPQLKQLLEFPVLFLGAAPADTPALYSLMNYADLKLGTWYPDGGMYKIAEAFYRIATSLGVKFEFNEAVRSFKYNNGNISHVITDKSVYETDMVIANADYHHVDQEIVSPELANYDNKYWEGRKMAPSSLLFFLGLDRKVKNLEHHNLFFDADFDKHAGQIYHHPEWPEDPLFYVCCPSRTDNTVAPPGHENLFVLIPLAPDLPGETSERTDQYLDIVIKRIKDATSVDISEHIVYKRHFGIRDFKSYYNSFKGNAYGLANTLFQTAILKPSIKSKKISNLYFTGQLTTPGPGLPPSVISGQVVANEVINDNK